MLSRSLCTGGTYFSKVGLFREDDTLCNLITWILNFSCILQMIICFLWGEMETKGVQSNHLKPATLVEKDKTFHLLFSDIASEKARTLGVIMRNLVTHTKLGRLYPLRSFYLYNHIQD